MGKRIGDYMKEAKPSGGKVCSIQGNPGADNILRRAQGWRDSLSGQEGLTELEGRRRLDRSRRLPGVHQ